MASHVHEILLNEIIITRCCVQFLMNENIDRLALVVTRGRENFDKLKIRYFINIFPRQNFAPYDISSFVLYVTGGYLRIQS